MELLKSQKNMPEKGENNVTALIPSDLSSPLKEIVFFLKDMKEKMMLRSNLIMYLFEIKERCLDISRHLKFIY